jgi:ABC-2 type transport system ATP-binding protein
MLELTTLQKSFGSYPVLAIEKLIIEDGIHWLKGPNGSGKSTLLRILAGLLPFKGTILLNGHISIRQHPLQYRLAVNHAPAEPSYPSFITGNELIDFTCSVKKGRDEQVRKIKDILGIDHYLDNPTGSYSSGMLKKLSLLLAFTGQPEWILLDEPFTTLDQSSQKALAGLIHQQAEAGISFILTSHHDIETVGIDFNNVFLVTGKQVIKTGAGQ